MTAQPLAAAPRLRRGSVVWRGRSAWLVWDATGEHQVQAFAIGRGSGRRVFHVLIVCPTEQLLTRIKGTVVVRLGREHTLPRAELEYAGELGPTMCKVSAAIARLVASRCTETRWSGDRGHRRRAYENKPAV